MNTIAIYLTAIVTIFCSGIGVGYKLEKNACEASQIEKIRYAVQQKDEELKSTFAAEKKSINEAHSAELVGNFLIKEVPKYVTKIQMVKSDCSYSNGTVRLLNAAAAGGYLHTNAVPVGTDAEVANNKKN